MLARTLVLATVSASMVALLACGGDDGRAADGGAATQGDQQGQAVASSRVRLAAVGRFDQPLYVTAPPADRKRIFIVEQAGRIVVVRNGHKLARSFLDLRRSVTSGGEQGLLGLAFAPDYARSHRFYVYFTGRDARQRLVEYRAASADRADAGSARTVFVHDDPEANHNGGQLAFGPDGLLYVGTGDGGGGDDQHGARGNAQDLGSPLGKILRIDPRPSGGRRFTVPADNPFVGRAGARGEIYAYGLRNPWRFSFDRRTGDLVIGDVGQNQVEEIDFLRRGRARGANFGWRPWEGRRRNFDEPAPQAVFPVLTKRHGDGWCSITGGYVVRDPRLRALAGRYVYGDFCRGQIRSVRLSSGRATGDRAVPGLPRIGSLSSFGEDASGRVYVVSLDGPVYRLASR